MLFLTKSVLAAAVLSTLAWSGGPSLKPVASFRLPARPDSTYGACSVGADQTRAVVGFSWGGRNQMTGGFNHLCRGFTLISLRTGAKRTVVYLPASQRKGLWTVDEPVLVGDWLAYQRYVGVADSNWQINIVNLRTGVVRQLDHRHGQGILDIGPVITKSGHMLAWVSGVRDSNGKVVFQIHTYNVLSGVGRIVATSQPGMRFMDAYMSGSIICFLRQTVHGTDVWTEDLRTLHTRQLTQTGKATEAIITGPWVAWHVLGSNALGAVVVEDLRTGQQRIITQEPSYNMSAGNGMLAWYSPRKDQWTVLDLMTGHTWQPSPIVKQQRLATMAHVQGDVVVQNALVSGEGLQGRVDVYQNRRLPEPPGF